jgi:hypothetical protein
MESEGWDYEDKDSFRVENLFPVDSGFLARRAAEDYRMTAAAAAELARLATCGREGGGEGEWEDDEAARGGGEDALRAEGDGMDYCVMTEWEQPRLDVDGGKEEEDDDDYDWAMMDEDYAAERNYRVYTSSTTTVPHSRAPALCST